MKVNSRYIGALVLAPLLIFVLLGGLPLKLFTIALSVCGLYEFYHALSTKEIKSIPIISYALLIAYYLLNNNFESISNSNGIIFNNTNYRFKIFFYGCFSNIFRICLCCNFI